MPLNQFIGRSAEQEMLEKAWAEGDSFVLVTGPAHVGKTAFVRRFCQGRPSLYFAASQAPDSLNREYFRQRLLDERGIETAPGSWMSLIKAYAAEAARGEVLVLDDVDHLLESGENFSKTVASFYARVLRPAGIMLICVISSGSVLKTIENKRRRPIKGVTARIDLKPVAFPEMLSAFTGYRFPELVSLYALTGGYPEYWPYLEGAPDLDSQLAIILERMLSRESGYYRIPPMIMEKNFWDPYFYTALLARMAEGTDTWAGLKKETGYRAKQLDGFIRNLYATGIIGYEMPGGSKKFSMKSARFHIEDPALRFYFTFLFPYASDVESADRDALLARIRRRYAAYLEEPFNRVARIMVGSALRQDDYGIRPESLGMLWNGENFTIPLFGVDKKEKKILVGQTAFSGAGYSSSQFDTFLTKAEQSGLLRPWAGWGRVYAFFSATQPHPEMIERARNDRDILLVSAATTWSQGVRF